MRKEEREKETTEKKWNNSHFFFVVVVKLGHVFLASEYMHYEIIFSFVFDYFHCLNSNGFININEKEETKQQNRNFQSINKEKNHTKRRIE